MVKGTPLYSYCESVTAVGPWHIRKLTDVGPKFGGGIDTPSLCGRVRQGWDIRCQVDAESLNRVEPCSSCKMVYEAILENF